MEKSRDAFRTISEVADWLDVPTHVLRFWESRFSQIKPVKRAGGRRYYRPSDMRVIGGVKTLLHDQGMTIRGVQKLFREQGIKHISSHSPALYGEEEAPIKEAAVIEHEQTEPAPPARSTRDAEPAPIIDDVANEGVVLDEAKVSEGVDESVTFEETDDAKVAEPVLQFSRSRATPAKAEPEPAPEPVEFSADVPQVDPQDDDTDHAASPGVAARLRMMPRETLTEHKDVLAAAVDKLKALQARAG